MSAIEKSVLTSPPVEAPVPLGGTHSDNAPMPPDQPKWLKLATPALVSSLGATIVVTITRNGNTWEGGRAEQITDVFVRGDVTPLSTKVAGRTVGVVSGRLRLEAFTLTFIDGFHLLAWSCVAALLLIALLRRSPLNYGELSIVQQSRTAPRGAK